MSQPGALVCVFTPHVRKLHEHVQEIVPGMERDHFTLTQHVTVSVHAQRACHPIVRCGMVIHTNCTCM